MLAGTDVKTIDGLAHPLPKDEQIGSALYHHIVTRAFRLGQLVEIFDVFLADECDSTSCGPWRWRIDLLDV